MAPPKPNSSAVLNGDKKKEESSKHKEIACKEEKVAEVNSFSILNDEEEEGSTIFERVSEKVRVEAEQKKKEKKQEGSGNEKKKAQSNNNYVSGHMLRAKNLVLPRHVLRSHIVLRKEKPAEEKASLSSTPNQGTSDSAASVAAVSASPFPAQVPPVRAAVERNRYGDRPKNYIDRSMRSTFYGGFNGHRRSGDYYRRGHSRTGFDGTQKSNLSDKGSINGSDSVDDDGWQRVPSRGKGSKSVVGDQEKPPLVKQQLNDIGLDLPKQGQGKQRTGSNFTEGSKLTGDNGGYWGNRNDNGYSNEGQAVAAGYVSGDKQGQSASGPTTDKSVSGSENGSYNDENRRRGNGDRGRNNCNNNGEGKSEPYRRTYTYAQYERMLDNKKKISLQDEEKAKPKPKSKTVKDKNKEKEELQKTATDAIMTKVLKPARGFPIPRLSQELAAKSQQKTDGSANGVKQQTHEDPIDDFPILGGVA
ncbi:hypothetical protein O6P43_024812 [Quillaja saponaria]|uniref:Uncharacterized protein n=1 Tax=Quillaja saponaria TaxID=32244 RepID=A0AAD7L7J1_QUISA|nr:hypothetical protein O6P43_024812 [Quillaja saponaria]